MTWWRDRMADAPSRHTLFAVAGSGLYLLILLDTVVRGPLTAGVVAVNDQVIAWDGAGYPVIDWGRELSKVGDFWLGWATVLAAAGSLFAVKAWRRALGVLATAALAPATVAAMHPLLLGLNRPIPGLSERLVPDTDSRLRVGGEHLFPSGHVVEATLDWGLLLLVALPVLFHVWGVAQPLRRRLLAGGVAVWALACAVTGVGRILRQAHGYNDVVAGWGWGVALLFGGWWAMERIPWLRDPVVARKRTGDEP